MSQVTLVARVPGTVLSQVGTAVFRRHGVLGGAQHQAALDEFVTEALLHHLQRDEAQDVQEGERGTVEEFLPAEQARRVRRLRKENR